MLLKLQSIIDVGRFGALKHKAPRFSRLSLIYGRNAQGKSTVCALLRAASLGDGQAVLARKRLASRNAPTANLEWATGITVFDGRRWTECHAPLHVFDQDYVERNVHVAGSVTRDNKRQMLQIIIGQRGVELAQSIAQIDGEIRTVSNRLGELERLIKAAHPVVTNVDTYCSYEIPADIEEQVVSASLSVNLARQAAEVRQRRAPQALMSLDITEYEALLSSTVAGVSNLTAERVAAHVASHKMERHGERWLKFGVDHMLGSECPFCAQDISDVELVRTFEGYFSEAYSAHLAQLEDAAAQLRSLETSIRNVVRQNYAEAAFWRNVTELPCELHVPDEQLIAVQQGITRLSDQFAKKTAHPFTALGLAGDDRPVVENALHWLQAYNQDVENCRVVVARAQAEAMQAEVGQAEDTLARRLALQAKTTEPLASHVAEYQALRQRKEELNQTKGAAQSDLRAHAATTFASREREINALLTLFGANFQIVDAKAGFVGREASTEYGIEIGAHVLRAGPTALDEPSFKTVLSTGDKYTLALALFFVQVRADPRLRQSVVVFDDPFSSQDMQRQWETGSQIRDLAREASQVLVFSHDPRFLHLIEKDADPSICSSFQVSFESDSEAAVKQWSASDELRTNYVRQAERIRHFANAGQFLADTNLDSLITDLRPFLEDFIKLRFPGRFGALQMLDEMIGLIEQAGATDPLYRHVRDLRALNEYTRGNHHAGASRPDPDALRAQCRRIVSIIGHY